MDYRWAKEEVNGWIQQFKIGYFEPHIIVTQMSEEFGELSKAILQKNKHAVGEELADVVFTLICMANRHDMPFKENYSAPIPESPSELYLASKLGEIAREVNHLYGPKKKKATEEKADLLQRLEEAFVAVNYVADANNINLELMFSEHMDKLYGRDNNRYERKDTK